MGVLPPRRTGRIYEAEYLAAVRLKAAVNAPQSRRFAKFGDVRQSRSVWSARVFSTAFRSFQCATRPVAALAVTCLDAAEPCTPCGACRQVMAEHLHPEAPISIDHLGEYRIADLLPLAFGLDVAQ